ncbi:MAG: ubiquinone/menaquinone biosynthesis methyltransferase [Dehalococcoidia bacterium]
MNDKSYIVQKMFNQIAKNYDLMNYIMSFGNHKKWEREIIKSVNKKNMKILDVACGTGSLTKELIKISNQNNTIGLDFSLSMLSIAKNNGIENTVLADGHFIPFKNKTFDMISIAYGIRNFSNLNQALIEIKRCLANNGELKIIEIIKPINTFKSVLFKIGFKLIAPLLGIIISRNISAYTYLPKSAELFLTVKEIKNILNKHNFKNIKIKQKFWGSVILLETKL